MESFYGGRQGASVVIKKHFDGINIPEKTYKNILLAVDQNGDMIQPIISKTIDNWQNYNWAAFKQDGQDGRPLAYAEGMVQSFSQGGDTVQDVGYGEYVIIDTISGLCQENNPDNGKLFRRGMNYAEPELAGAEYIGQIVGPQGNAPTLDIGSFTDILNQEKAQIGYYGIDNDDLIAGTANSGINYGWYSVKDEYGNVIGTKIGFQFPYLVEEFTGVAIEPYIDGTSEGFENRELIQSIFNYPYYKRWKINIPKGYKGDSISDVSLKYDGTVEYKIKNFDNFQNGEESDFIAINEDNPITWIKEITYGLENGQVLVKYNTENSQAAGVRTHDTFVLNIITDFKVTTAGQFKYKVNAAAVPPGHLLVKYSNSLEAQGLYEKNPQLICYLFEDEQKEDNWYYDLGFVKGDSGSFLTARTFTSIEEVGNIPPEDLMGDIHFAGWAIAVGENTSSKAYYNYDYQKKQWVYIGKIKSNETYFQENNPNTDGIWYKTANRKTIE